MTRLIRRLTLGALLLALPQAVLAKQVTVAFDAVVDFVFDPAGRFGLSSGDAFTGSVVYESAALDACASPTDGCFSFDGPPLGMFLSGAGWQISTASGAGAFAAFAENGSRDFLGFQSRQSEAAGLAGSVQFVYWALWDDSATALSSDALPSEFPSLSSFAGQSLGIDLSDAMLRGRVTNVRTQNLRTPQASARAQERANGHSAVQLGVPASELAAQHAAARAAFNR